MTQREIANENKISESSLTKIKNQASKIIDSAGELLQLPSRKTLKLSVYKDINEIVFN